MSRTLSNRALVAYGCAAFRRFRGIREMGANKLGHEVKDFSIIAGLFEFMGLSWLVAA